ncbi:hypothetical protein NP493_2522g00000 [Ridgeia piscesae]|uniref:VWF/SSPO/Zonadhesin-like cysteine-rich domain-containing protein n=1 Tax=Ridgeia piscesae TaxID=27915 RepID=A0AAD9N2T0_RIDPI|nr:hypothetical protein NP493_2522g00000 [Ridgeia piscesae]
MCCVGDTRKHCEHRIIVWSWNKIVISFFRTEDRVKLACITRNTRKFNGLKYCGALNNKRGPFRKCLRNKREAGQNFYRSCMYDACANQRNTRLVKKLACESVDAFAGVCGEKLLQRNWRNRTGCRCPGELVWTKCGRECTRTCRKPNIKCSFKCVAKCQCPRSRPYQQGISCLDARMCRKLKLWQPV